MDNKIIAGVIIIAILIVGGYLFYTSGPIVSAQGFSSLSVKPDEVSVYMNVETRDNSAQEAKDKNVELTDKLVESLIDLGFKKEEIQLISYNIYPEYDWSNGDNKIKGYVVSQQIVVKTTDFEKTTSIVDAAVDSGALISYINFEISEEKQSDYKAEALKAAGEDAKKKAEATAAGFDKKLGRLVSVNSEQFNYGPFVYYDRVLAESSGSEISAQKAAVDLAPQNLEVTASVSAQYKLRVF